MTRLPAGAEVIIVGGGIAGAAAGFSAARAGASVVLLEREAQLALHTTGRSAAVHLGNYGAEPVRRLALASLPFLAEPPDDLADHSLVGDRGLLDVGEVGTEEQLREHAEQGAALIEDIQLLGPAEAVGLCPALRADRLAGAVYEPGACDIDVMGLHAAFLRGLRQHGGTVQPSTGVRALTHVGRRWRVETAQGVLSAATVVNAAGPWADQVAVLAGLAPLGLRPLHRTAFVASLPSGVDARGWPLVQDLAEGWYFKPEGDALLCSLADETPAEPGDPRPRDEDVALAMERINDATTLGLRHVRSAWAGLRTFAPDRLPVVGLDPRLPGLVWIAGLGGFGIMTAPAVGELAGAAAVGQPAPSALAGVAVQLLPDRLC